MQRYFDVVQNRQGTAVVGATVTVYDANGNLATLYSNNSGAASSNPVYTNSDGEYAFYAANGTYSITIAQAGYATETKPGVVLFDPSDSGASNNVQFLQAGTGAQVRSVQSKLRDVVSVKDFGAVGDGVADDTAAFAAAAIAAGDGNPIYVPSGKYLKSTISNEQNYFWSCGNALDPSGLFPISLLGHVEQAYANRRLLSNTATSPAQVTDFQINRSFNYSGGTFGVVCSAQQITTDVSAGVNDFIWGLLSILNNNSNNGENVAIYGQANRITGTSAIWAGVFEASDKTNTSGAGKSGLVGVEVDVFANGADVNSNRVGIDVVVGKGAPAGLACEATIGVRVNPQNSSISNGTWNVGFAALGCVAVDFLAQSASTAAFQAFGTNTYAFFANGTHTVGIDFSSATISGNAIRIAAGQTIALNATGTITVEYNLASDSILFKNSGITKHTFSMA
jgi:hypothetical protein